MATNEPYSTALYTLQQGPIPVTYQLVVPEGFTVRQIAAAVGHLKGAGISQKAFLEAATGGQVRSPYEPAGSNDLEGLLFPATYPVQQGETADELVQYMVATFDTHAAALGLTAAAQRLGYRPYQVITVASIVEREVKFEADRGGVASVIYNRLVRGIPIGAESTLLYGLGDPKGAVVITTPNPYNTLVNKGLPPTPISNPGNTLAGGSHEPPQDDLPVLGRDQPRRGDQLRLHRRPVQAAPGRVPGGAPRVLSSSGRRGPRPGGVSVARGLQPRRWSPASSATRSSTRCRPRSTMPRSSSSASTGPTWRSRSRRAEARRRWPPWSTSASGACR